MLTSLREEAEPPTQTASEPHLVVYHSNRDLIVGSAENLMLVVWRNATTRDGVEICRKHLMENCSGRGCEFAIMTIVEQCAQLPEAAARDDLAALMHEGSRWIQVSALVFEGTGFIAAAIRGVVTGISMFARQSFPHRVFDSVSDASSFIEREQSRTNQMPFAAWRMEASVAELRRRANG
jgi:hypothetical protein